VRLLDSTAPTSYEVSVGAQRPATHITNCRFERLNGINMTSGGSLSYPGNAKVVNCSFHRCGTGVRFAFASGAIVSNCDFEGGGIDVYSSSGTESLRALHNTHRNCNATDTAGNGAYVIRTPASGDTTTKGLWSIIGCKFVNVKRIHEWDATSGSFSTRIRMLIFRDNDVDTLSTGLPTGSGVLTLINNNQKTWQAGTGAFSTDADMVVGDTVWNSSPDDGAPVGWVNVDFGGTVTSLPIEAQTYHRTHTASPVSVLTPLWVGEEVLDTNNSHWYKSVGTSITAWKLITI
jgi:hypothetical protein